jgi:Uma2 family endonuclease
MKQREVTTMQEQLVLDSPGLEPQPIRLMKLTVEQYHEMIAAGILTEDNRIELLEGWLVEKMTKNNLHIYVNEEAAALLRALNISGWTIYSQQPIALDDSEPEPDICIVRGKRSDYLRHKADADAVGLVIEISHTTLMQDRGLKQRIYARAGIPVYWIINLVDRQVEVYTRPGDEGYTTRTNYAGGEAVPVMLDGVEAGRLVVNDVMP